MKNMSVLFLTALAQKHFIVSKLKKDTYQKSLAIWKFYPNQEEIVQKLLTKHINFSITMFRKLQKKTNKTTQYLHFPANSLFKTPTVLFLYFFVLWSMHFVAKKVFYHPKKTTVANSVTTLNYISKKQNSPATQAFKKNYKTWKKHLKFTAQPLLLTAKAKQKNIQQITINNLIKSKYILILTIYLLSINNYTKKTAAFKKPLLKKKFTAKAAFSLYCYMANKMLTF